MNNFFKISGVLLIVFLYSCTKVDDNTIKDADGNEYNTIKIGSQFWMKENLKTTKYNDGDPIPLILAGTAWKNLFTEGCCWYPNDIADSMETYGLLYNWHTVNTKKLCPEGWHVPTDAEWHTMVGSLDDSVSLTIFESLAAGDKLKEAGNSHWAGQNSEATNETGFTALPGGYRNVNGDFYGIGNFGSWWSSTEAPTNDGNAITRVMDATAMVGKSWGCKNEAFSVRCVKNN